MQKVMIVDDERLILQGILNIIDWDELGLKVVHLAENGLDALENFKNDPVDIIVTDINMPILSGLDLIKEIRKLNKKTKFIILSGYDDFSYAKTAIQYGVENYILKPINEEELQEVLLTLRKRIEEENKKENNLLNKNRIFMKFLDGSINIDVLKDIEEIININFNDKNYIVSNIIINNKEFSQFDKIKNIVRQNTNERYELIFKFNGDIVLINSWNKEKSKDEMLEYYNCIKNNLKKNINEDIFIGIGKMVHDMESIRVSYENSNKIKKYVLTKGYDLCLFEDDVINIKEENRSFIKEIEKLHKLIIEKNEEEIIKYVSKIFDDNTLTPKSIYDLSIKILLLVDEVSEEFRYNKSYIRDGLSNIIIELCNESNRNNIKKFLISEISELTKVMNSNNIKYSPIVQQIVNCVNEKYYEELSLKTLSNKYNINSSYLGQIFNKEIGCTFSEYLNKYKNMKAKELILNTNMRINDIAKEVGYFDTSYFYRKFKKYYGVSPSTLRDIKQY